MDNGETASVTKKITVSGIVQGVGFRPLVYRLAQKHNINGTVRNIGGLAEIIAQSAKQDFDLFLEELKESKDGARILHLEIEDVNDREYREFRIAGSENSDETSVIPPDIAVCGACRAELACKNDRRFQNPFISCMSCGPRYTIIEKLPYDRENTTMTDFDMCPQCRDEYVSPKDRRFHAQTISCNDCGPYLILRSSDDEFVNEEALDAAGAILQSGGIVAVKGIGGYHFAASVFKEDTVQNLRKLKGREEKPFAVMFESVEEALKYCNISETERILLESKEKPIVLLYNKAHDMAPSVCKDSVYCGAFLAYTPLQILLAQKCGPLVMTSANISDKPVIKEDGEIVSLKSPFLSGVLYHTRRIVRSVDDSVARVTDGKPQIIRRSRGYVPYPVFLSHGNKDLQIFAAGGDLKAAFCLYKNGGAVVSQYFGDLEERAVLDEYKRSAYDLSSLFNVKPDLAVCDLHPNYHSAGYAKSLGIPTVFAQHHHAHIASVMAEHNIDEPVIGAAFDGTGYGTDGNVWGGEFLLCEGAEFQRLAHLAYTPMLGGDSSMKDAKKTAACFLLGAGLNRYIKDGRAGIIQAAVQNKVNTVLSSSMGRLFDAVASILDIRHHNSYEGECAAALEREAFFAIKKRVKPAAISFSVKRENEIMEIDPKPVLEAICELKGQADTGSLALGFHYAVADLILDICKTVRDGQGINVAALGGGVFQNAVLTEYVLKLLTGDGFRVYYNRAVPPNDGSISLGQTYIGLMR